MGAAGHDPSGRLSRYPDPLVTGRLQLNIGQHSAAGDTGQGICSSPAAAPSLPPGLSLHFSTCSNPCRPRHQRQQNLLRQTRAERRFSRETSFKKLRKISTAFEFVYFHGVQDQTRGPPRGVASAPAQDHAPSPGGLLLLPLLTLGRNVLQGKGASVTKRMKSLVRPSAVIRVSGPKCMGRGPEGSYRCLPGT